MAAFQVIVLVDFKGEHFIYSRATKYFFYAAMFSFGASTGLWIIYQLLCVLYNTLLIPMPNKLRWSLSVMAAVLFCESIFVGVLRFVYFTLWVDTVASFWVMFVSVYILVLLNVESTYLYCGLKQSIMDLENVSVSQGSRNNMARAMRRLRTMQIVVSVLCVSVGLVGFVRGVTFSQKPHDPVEVPDPTVYTFDPFIYLTVFIMAVFLWYVCPNRQAFRRGAADS